MNHDVYTHHIEQAFIASLLVGGFENIPSDVSEHHFTTTANRIIFKRLQEAYEAGRTRDVLTLQADLTDAGELEMVGGVEYLRETACIAFAPEAVSEYARVLRESYGKRRLEQAITASSSLPLTERRDLLLNELIDLDAGTQQGAKHRSVGADDALDRIDKIRAGELDANGVSTGFIDLDRHTSGMHPGELIIIAARPGMGKTAFALNIADHVAMTVSRPVLFFTMEMSMLELTNRGFSSLSGVSNDVIRSGDIDNVDYAKIKKTKEAMAHAPFYIDESPNPTAAHIRAQALQVARIHGDIGAVFIDYLQLMSTSDTNRAEGLSKITRALKQLAREVKAPVVLLSQLNRSVEQRRDKVPLMSDLRESGAIEQDADKILMLYRASYYKRKQDDLMSSFGLGVSPMSGGADPLGIVIPASLAPEESESATDVLLVKNRAGPCCNVKLEFEGRYFKFSNRSKAS